MMLVLFVEWTLRLGLAVALVSAGAVKTYDRERFMRAILGTTVVPGVVQPIVARIASYALPVVEILLGLFLLTSGAGAAAWLAALLFGVFLVYVTIGYLRHEPGECGCFGSALPSGFTLATVGRNALLTFGAVLLAIIASGSSVADARVAPLSAEGTVTVTAAVALVALLLALAAMNLRPGREGGEPEPGLPKGERIPQPGWDVIQEALRTTGGLAQCDREHAVSLIVLTSDSCHHCEPVRAFLSDLDDGSPAVSLSPTVHVYALELDPEAALPEPTVRSGAIPEISIHARSMAEMFGVYGTPAAVAISEDGTILEDTVAGSDAVVTAIKAHLGHGDDQSVSGEA